MKLLITILSFLLFAHSTYSQHKELNPIKHKKIALVIGVAKYQYVTALNNTTNDAIDMDSVLTKDGFEVTSLLNPTYQQMSAAVDSFGKKMFSADVCLFFYSGHGAEVNGENYIFPTTAHPSIPDDLNTEAIPLRKIMARISLSKIKTSIILLDACRSNPFTKSWDKEFGTKEGLAVVEFPPNGSFIGYAASPGKVASDGNRKNGTYTQAILKYINEKSLSIDQLFNKVNKEVRSLSNGNQVPFKSSSLDDEYYFMQPNNVLASQSISTKKMDAERLGPSMKKFPLPKSIKGYSLGRISDFAKVGINKLIFNQDDTLSIAVTQFTRSSLWDKTTPIYVELVKLASKDAMGGVMEFQNEYQPSSSHHIIDLLVDFPAGMYELRVGFYFISELNADYPEFKSKAYRITVK